MAVVRDDSSSAASAGVSTVTVAHTIAAGSDLLLLALLVIDSSADENPVTPTWAGSSTGMTQITEIVGTANSQHLIGWYLVNPTTGANNLVFDWDTSLGGGGIAISYSGVDQVTPIDGLQTGSGTVESLSETVTSAAGDMVVDFAGVNGSLTVTLGGDGSQLENFNAGGGGGTMAVAGEAAGAASVTRSWSWTGAQRAAQVAFNINASAGGGGGDPIPVHRAGRGAGW